MTRITLQGIGVVGAFGAGIEALAVALECGQSPRSTLAVPTGRGPVELPAYRADTSDLKAFVPAMALRRMDHFTRMGLLGAHLALKDAGLSAGEERLGLVIASGYGATATTYALLDSIIRDGDAGSSPTAFSASLHNACAASIAIQLGCTGPNLTVSQFDLSVPSALLSARQWLLEGRVERVLFGAIDELSELIGYLWYQQRGLPEGPMEPLRFDAETAVPGEGAAFFVLSRREEAKAAYCTLESVEMGHGLERAPKKTDLLMLGADGRKEYGLRYAAAAQGAHASCATPLYGRMPASPAFDLAVAAMLLKSQRAKDAACLTLADSDGYGRVDLSRA